MKDFELTFFFCVLFLPPNQSSICSSTSSIEAPWSYNGIYALDSRTVYTGNSDFGFLTLSFFSSIQKQKRRSSNATNSAEKYNSEAGLGPQLLMLD